MAYADERGKREPEVPNPIAPPAVGNRPADRELPTVEPDIQIQNEAPGYEIPDDAQSPEDLENKNNEEEEPAPAPIAPPEPEPEPEPEPQYTVPPEQQLELKQANVWEPHYTFDEETGEATVEEANPVQPSSGWTQEQIDAANNARKRQNNNPAPAPVETVPETNPVDYTTPTQTIVTPNLAPIAGQGADITVGDKANMPRNQEDDWTKVMQNLAQNLKQAGPGFGSPYGLYQAVSDLYGYPIGQLPQDFTMNTPIMSGNDPYANVDMTVPEEQPKGSWADNFTMNPPVMSGEDPYSKADTTVPEETPKGRWQDNFTMNTPVITGNDPMAQYADAFANTPFASGMTPAQPSDLFEARNGVNYAIGQNGLKTYDPASAYGRTGLGQPSGLFNAGYAYGTRNPFAYDPTSALDRSGQPTAEPLPRPSINPTPRQNPEASVDRVVGTTNTVNNLLSADEVLARAPQTLFGNFLNGIGSNAGKLIDADISASNGPRRIYNNTDIFGRPIGGSTLPGMYDPSGSARRAEELGSTQPQTPQPQTSVTDQEYPTWNPRQTPRGGLSGANGVNIPHSPDSITLADQIGNPITPASEEEMSEIRDNLGIVDEDILEDPQWLQDRTGGKSLADLLFTGDPEVTRKLGQGTALPDEVAQSVNEIMNDPQFSDIEKGEILATLFREGFEFTGNTLGQIVDDAGNLVGAGAKAGSAFIEPYINKGLEKITGKDIPEYTGADARTEEAKQTVSELSKRYGPIVENVADVLKDDLKGTPETPTTTPNPVNPATGETTNGTPWRWADDAPMTFTDEDGNVWSYNSAYDNYVRPINGIDRTTGKPRIEGYAQYTGDNYKVPALPANSTGGNWNYVDAMEGYYSDADAIPRINEDGTMNDAMRELTYAMVDEDGNDLYTEFDQSGNPHYYQLKQKADGTYDYVPYYNKVERKYDPMSILTTFVNSSYDGTNNLYRGMEWMNDLSPEEQAGMNELLATLYRRGDEYFGINRESGDRSDRPYEIADMTPDEYVHFIELFMKNMPALQVLMDRGVLKDSDIAQFFFKDIKTPGNGNGNKNGGGYGSSRYRSYGGGGRGGGYRGGGGGSSYMPSYTNPYSQRSSSGGGYTRGGGISSSSGGAEISRSAEPTQTNQRQNRVYNIMKNWSF